MRKLIKCRFCSYETALWGKKKEPGEEPARNINGYGRLRYHVERHHPTEWKKLVEIWVEEDCLAPSTTGPLDMSSFINGPIDISRFTKR